MTSDVQENFIRLWINDIPATQTHFINVLCPRNMVLFGQSTSPRETWSRLESFLSRLLKNKLLIPITLEAQCLNLLKQEWPKVILFVFNYYSVILYFILVGVGTIRELSARRSRILEKIV